MSPLYTSLIQVALTSPMMDENISLPWGYGDGLSKVQGQPADFRFCGSESYRQYTGLCVWSQMYLGVTPGIATSLGQQPNFSEISPIKCG